MLNELELQKAKGKSLAAHFKKAASHHEKMADIHEKCMKAHESCADHHEGMMGKEMEMASGGADHFKTHHKTKMNFHKSMAKHHEALHKAHAAHAEHNHTMVDAMTEKDEAEKAFKVLGVEIEPTAAPVVVPPTSTQSTSNPTITSTGDPNMSKTDPAAPVTAAPGTLNNPETNVDLNKQFTEGLQSALKNGLNEALASPEFKKTVQEQIGNMLLTELSRSSPSLAPTQPVKVFAVPRNSTQTADIAKGATPTLTGLEHLDPSLADLVNMGN